MADFPKGPARPDSHAWVLRSRDLLEGSAAALDGAAVSRLNRARQRALAQLDSAPREAGALRWIGGAAVTAGLALVLWRALLLPSLPAAPGPTGASTLPPAAVVSPAPSADAPVAAPDFDLLADAESYALVEDLEFYAWLQASEDAGG